MTGVLSVVIPLYRLDECRLRNLSFIYDRLTEEIDQDHLDLIFSIQVSEKDVHKLRGFRRARKQYVLISDDKFHKSKLLNYGASCSIGSFILFLDSDIHFKSSDGSMTTPPLSVSIQKTRSLVLKMGPQ